MWCRPLISVGPMYIPGRLRTASRPSSTVICSAPYSCVTAVFVIYILWFACVVSRRATTHIRLTGKHPTVMVYWQEPVIDYDKKRDELLRVLCRCKHSHIQRRA